MCKLIETSEGADASATSVDTLRNFAKQDRDGNSPLPACRTPDQKFARGLEV